MKVLCEGFYCQLQVLLKVFYTCEQRPEENMPAGKAGYNRCQMKILIKSACGDLKCDIMCLHMALAQINELW